MLRDEDRRWQGALVRARRYLYIDVEQEHRAIKQLCAPILGLKGFRSAVTTLANSGPPTRGSVDPRAPMQQQSTAVPDLRRARIYGPVRLPRKISVGGNLNLLVQTQGGQYSHFHYPYGGKRKTLSFGTYPDVPITVALARHRARGDYSLRASALR